MLFTDGSIATVDQLAEYEAEVRAIASAENINLESKLRLAQTEIGVELLATSVQPDGQTSRHPFLLAQVVVTDALRLWHIFHTLATLYRDAYNRRLNDKYRPKWTEYQEMAKAAAGQCMAIGVALVFSPLPAPEAPSLTVTPGGSLAATTYYARTSWVAADGQESYGSPAAALAVATSNLLAIQPAAAPGGATGWFPYAGTESTRESRQTNVPVALGESWTMAAEGLVSGPLPGSGQRPDVLRTVPRTLQRG